MISYQSYYYRVPKKDGTLGKRVDFDMFRYCELAVCDRCGKLGNADIVRKWWYKVTDLNVREPILCFGCFNVMRPAWRDERNIEECTYLLNRLKEAITRARKAENDRTASGFSNGHDAPSQGRRG